jgi:hypothetical protein
MPSNLGANAPRDSGETESAAKKIEGRNRFLPSISLLGAGLDPHEADRSGRHSAASAGSAHYLGSVISSSWLWPSVQPSFSWLAS